MEDIHPYILWLEVRDWADLEPGDQVVYLGPDADLYGTVYKVVARLDDGRYTLSTLGVSFSRINADRFDLTPTELMV